VVTRCLAGPHRRSMESGYGFILRVHRLGNPGYIQTQSLQRSTNNKSLINMFHEKKEKEKD